MPLIVREAVCSDTGQMCAENGPLQDRWVRSPGMIEGQEGAQHPPDMGQTRESARSIP